MFYILPDEILVQVFDYLPPICLFMSCLNVCNQWKRAIHEYIYASEAKIAQRRLKCKYSMLYTFVGGNLLLKLTETFFVDAAELGHIKHRMTRLIRLRSLPQEEKSQTLEWIGIPEFDVNSSDSDGETFLHSMVEYNRPDVLSVLLRREDLNCCACECKPSSNELYYYAKVDILPFKFHQWHNVIPKLRKLAKVHVMLQACNESVCSMTKDFF